MVGGRLRWHAVEETTRTPTPNNPGRCDSLPAERMFLLPPHTTTTTTASTTATSRNDNDNDNELVVTLKADFEKETTTQLCTIDTESILLGSSSPQGNAGKEQQQQQQQRPNKWEKKSFNH